MQIGKGGVRMTQDNVSEKKTIILCIVLLSVFLVFSGVYVTCKCAFSDKNLLPMAEENLYENIENPENGSTVTVGYSVPEKRTMVLEQEEGLIVQGEYDIREIPDKYNTGCGTGLVTIDGDKEINKIVLAYSGNNLVFDFFYRNKEVSGTITFENYNFSNYPVVVYHEGDVKGKEIKLVFKNCKFATFKNSRPESTVFSYEFYNCSFNRFEGSNAFFSKCRFGGSYNDGMIPFSNITVKDCYFSDFATNDPAGNGIHSDGTQMYGYSDSPVQNVLFSNCRFEIPAVQTTRSTAYVNSCIMLSMEYNDGKNIIIEDCLLNGGGYTIYAGKKYDTLSLTDVYLDNIKIGAAKLYGNIYPYVDSNVVFSDVNDQNSLYVSSVWNDGLKTHVVVSNDTAEERILRVVTGTTTQDFVIKACLGGLALRNDNKDIAFEEFPFDVDVSVDSDADYVICFDVTDGCENQIRYVSFDGLPTYYDVNYGQEDFVQHGNGEGAEIDDTTAQIISEGKCGKDLVYSINDKGVLRIEGSGEMYNYNSKNPAPWLAYSDSVKIILVSEGITRIGAQAFRLMRNVEQIDLPQSVNIIGANAFIECSKLKNISFYSGVTNISGYAFHATKLEKCTYYGSKNEWEAIKIDGYNAPLLSCEKVYIQKEDTEGTVIIEGICGKDIIYRLSDKGILRIEGSGEMYNYNSKNPAPWLAYSDSVKIILVSEGITRIGAQAFRLMRNVEQIDLPQSVNIIGANAFIECSKLKNISFYSGVTNISGYAFHATKLEKCTYYGSKNEWEAIKIDGYNAPLLSCEKVYIQKEDTEGTVIIEGNCGKDIIYHINSKGTLLIEGSGEMYDYNGKNPAPWFAYSDSIKSIFISEGITRIGDQAFRLMCNVEQIDLPQSVNIIGANAFIGCNKLKNISFYSGVTTIKGYAFYATKLEKCTYYGGKNAWEAIKIDWYNTPLLLCEKIYVENS